MTDETRQSLSRQGGSAFNEGPARIYMVPTGGQPFYIDTKEPAAEVRAKLAEPMWPTLHYLDGEPFVVNPARVETIAAMPAHALSEGGDVEF